MKKFITYLIKKFGLVVACLMLGIISLTAQTTVFTWLPNSNVVTNLIVSGPVTIKRVTVSGVGTLPTFLFYDYNTNLSNPFGSLQYSNTTAFSNLVTIPSFTNSVIFTNSLGLARTNQYVGQFSYWTNVGAATASNALPIGTLTAQSGVPYTVDVNWVITKGLTVRLTNGFGPTITLEYQ